MSDKRLSQVDELIMREVYRRGRVRSLAALALDHLLGYANAHQRVKRLEASGHLQIERPGPGLPLVMTLGPDAPRQLVFDWPLHPPQRGQGAP